MYDCNLTVYTNLCSLRREIRFGSASDGTFPGSKATSKALVEESRDSHLAELMGSLLLLSHCWDLLVSVLLGLAFKMKTTPPTPSSLI